MYFPWGSRYVLRRGFPQTNPTLGMGIKTINPILEERCSRVNIMFTLAARLLTKVFWFFCSGIDEEWSHGLQLVPAHPVGLPSAAHDIAVEVYCEHLWTAWTLGSLRNWAFYALQDEGRTKLAAIGLTMIFLIPPFSNDGEIIHNRGGGFKKFLFSQLLGEMILTSRFFQMVWNHQQDNCILGCPWKLVTS